MRLLIIEDENAIAEPLKQAFERRNFAVDIAVNGKSGYQQAVTTTYDCLILDLNLPELDGLEVARRLRREQINTPILMLTARTRRDNIIEGFESGTDDYLAKPFDLRELILRVQALIKRSSSIHSEKLVIEDIEVDTVGLKVYKGGNEVKLNSKEYGILEYLMRQRSKVISQEELLEHVWNDEIDSFTQTVRTNIKTLRQKIDPDKNIIKTFKGRGYIID